MDSAESVQIVISMCHQLKVVENHARNMKYMKTKSVFVNLDIIEIKTVFVRLAQKIVHTPMLQNAVSVMKDISLIQILAIVTSYQNAQTIIKELMEFAFVMMVIFSMNKEMPV